MRAPRHGLNQFDPVRADDIGAPLSGLIKTHDLNARDQCVANDEVQIAADQLVCAARAIAGGEADLARLCAGRKD